MDAKQKRALLKEAIEAQGFELVASDLRQGFAHMRKGVAVHYVPVYRNMTAKDIKDQVAHSVRHGTRLDQISTSEYYQGEPQGTASQALTQNTDAGRDHD